MFNDGSEVESQSNGMYSKTAEGASENGTAREDKGGGNELEQSVWHTYAAECHNEILIFYANLLFFLSEGK